MKCVYGLHCIISRSAAGIEEKINKETTFFLSFYSSRTHSLSSPPSKAIGPAMVARTITGVNNTTAGQPDDDD